MSVEEVERFYAESDGGAVHVVIVFQRFHEARTLSEGSFRVAGSKSLVLSDGRHVTPTDDPEAFKIVDTDEIIRKIG